MLSASDTPPFSGERRDVVHGASPLRDRVNILRRLQMRRPASQIALLLA